MSIAGHFCRRLIPLAALTVILLLANVQASAQVIQSHPEVATSQPAVVDEPYSYPKIMLAMGLVVGLIFACKWGASKVSPSLNQKNGKSLSVLSRLAVGPKQQLLLVKVGRRAILVGHSAGAMNPLCEITDADELAHLVGQAEAEKAPAPINGFAALFKKREKEFEPNSREIVSVNAPEEDQDLAQLARRELLGLTERVRGLSKEMNGL